MFKKPWVQQLLIGVVIWVVGSAIWTLISNGLHIPGFSWSSISFFVEIVFFVFLWNVALPFATGHLNLYFARKNLEFQREQLEFEERKAVLQAPTAKEPPKDAPTK